MPVQKYREIIVNNPFNNNCFLEYNGYKYLNKKRTGALAAPGSLF
jgi:hypothetical protein